MDRIVVGADGSPPSIAAAVWAAGEATMRDLELTIVHVVAASAKAPTHVEGPRTPFPSGYTNDLVAQGVDVNDRTLDAVAKGVDRQPPRITSLLCFGPVVPMLWEFTRHGAHMIVLGQHRQDSSRRAPLRSVTSELLQTAQCPVAVVPHRAVAPARASQAPIVVGIDRQPAQLAIAMAFDEAARRTVRSARGVECGHWGCIPNGC